MRRGLHVLGMALCCVLLLVAYGLLAPQEVAQDAVTPEENNASSYFMLYEGDIAKLVSITVQPKGEAAYTVVSDMAFDPNGQLLGVYNSLSQPFLVKGQEDFTLSSTTWQMLLLTAQHIPATASYPALDQDACGLRDPEAILTLDWQDGTQTVLRIGRLTSDGMSCYVTMNGEDTVYLVPYDFHDTMCRALTAHHTLPGRLQESVSSAVQIAVTGTQEGQIIASKSSSAASVLEWHVDSPITHDGNTERIERFIEGVCAIAAEEYITTVTTTEQLTAYGLSQPLRLIAAFQDGTIRDIHIGDDAGEGRVYVRMNHTGDIYTISRTQLAFAEQVGLNTLLDRYVLLAPSANVTEVTLQTGDGTCHTLSVKYATEDDNQGEMWYHQGTPISRSEYASRYASMIALTFDRTAPEESKANGEMLAKITFTRRDGTQQQVRYDAYDAYYALATTDGGGRFLVRRSQVDAMLAGFSN